MTSNTKKKTNPAPASRLATQTPPNHFPVAKQSAPLGYVPLPAVPKSKSPVPWLSSIHATPGRGNYGDGRYRGNCSGLLVRDLLLYFRPQRVFDPMTGGGTCPDVCRELGIPCISRDVRTGFDATTPEAFKELGRFGFVWLHPPYWRMIRWSDDPRCLANAPTLEVFLSRLRALLRNCAEVLTPSGVIAVLMGDHRHEGRYLALPFRTFLVAEEEGFELAAPEIIRFSHGTTSAAEKEYPVSIIPRVHDVCLVLRRADRRPAASSRTV